jgi:hypothetical protein
VGLDLVVALGEGDVAGDGVVVHAHGEVGIDVAAAEPGGRTEK